MIVQLNPKQLEAADIFLNSEKTDVIYYGGGVGGGKSFFLCAMCLMSAYATPGIRNGLARLTLKGLKSSTMQTLYQFADMYGFKVVGRKRDVRDKCIHMTTRDEMIVGAADGHSTIQLFELTPKPSEHQSMQKLGSNEFTHIFIDEAGEIAQAAHDMLLTRFDRWAVGREAGIKGKIVYTGNPAPNFTREWKLSHDRGDLPDNIAFVEALLSDNEKNLPNYRKQLEGLSEAEKQRLLYGNWNFDNDYTRMVAFEDIINIFGNRLNQRNPRIRIGVDVARTRDRTVILVAKGDDIIDSYIDRGIGIDQQAEIVKKFQAQYKVRNSDVIVDEDGVGGGLVDLLKCTGFHNNGKVLMEGRAIPNYANLQTQCAFRLAKKIKACEYAITDKKLINHYKQDVIRDLEWLKTDRASDTGKLKMIPKNMIRDQYKSPDIRDTMLMLQYYSIYDFSGMIS